MEELKEYLKEGGAKEVFVKYAVEIGDTLWNALYSYVETAYPDVQNGGSVYRIEGVFEESEQAFVVLQSRADEKYYRLNFSLGEENEFVPSDTLIEITSSYTPAEEPQFALEAVEEFETEYAKKKKAEEEDKDDKDNQKKSEDNSDDDGEKEKCPKCGKPLDECECEDEDDEKKKDKKKYNLEEVVEYAELMAEYETLKDKYSALETECNSLKSEIEPLKAFKLEAEKKDKQAMIDQFYMLSDEDKADVIANIDTYSVDDIEAKLSIICVRNKVSFDLDENNKNTSNPTIYNLNNNDNDDANVPAWVKSLRETAKSM